MRNLTCMIIDDEPLAVKLLESFVSKTPSLQLCGAFTDPIEALSQLKENPVDLLFLDIQMPDIDGLELSKIITEPTRVIFTTAFREYAFEGFEVNALDFLLKPIRFSKFSQSVEKALRWFELNEAKSAAPTIVAPQPKEQKEIFLRVDGELKRVELDDIMYVCGMKDYVMFYMVDSNRPLITHLTMKATEDMLPQDRFMRVSRSYIVALNKIRSIDRNMCLYVGNEPIRVTDSYKEVFEKYIEGLS